MFEVEVVVEKSVRVGAGLMGWAPLVDVSGLPLAALTATSQPVLAQALRRVLAGLDDPNGVISAFDSFASSE